MPLAVGPLEKYGAARFEIRQGSIPHPQINRPQQLASRRATSAFLMKPSSTLPLDTVTPPSISPVFIVVNLTRAAPGLRACAPALYTHFFRRRLHSQNPLCVFAQARASRCKDCCIHAYFFPRKIVDAPCASRVPGLSKRVAVCAMAPVPALARSPTCLRLASAQPRPLVSQRAAFVL